MNFNIQNWYPIHLLILIILIVIIYYLRENKDYTKNSIITKICKQNIFKIKSEDFLKKAKLSDKIYVKEFNKKYFPDMECAKTYYIFEDENYLKEIVNKLPKKYVLKYSSGTGTNIIVDTDISTNKIINKCKKIKSQIKDISWKFKKIMNKYKDDVNPRFMIEEYLDNSLIDYKFWVIKGNVVFLQIAGNRYGNLDGILKGSKKGEFNSGNVLFNMYDDTGKLNNSILKMNQPKYEYKKIPYKLPKNFNRMKAICKEFYKITGFDFVRVDFYEINNKIYFGEYTFYASNCYWYIDKKYEKYLIDKYKFNENNKKNIWMYWENKNGTKKPSYIELCHKTIMRNCNDFNIHLLDEKTIHNFLPNLRRDLDNKLSIPQKADYYRYQLLYTYGGIWLDSDIIVFKSLEPLMEKLDKYDYIGSGCNDNNCNKTGYPKPSNWMMISKKNTKFMKMCIDESDRIINSSKDINYHKLGRELLWKNINILKRSGWDYYHLSSICMERDSKNVKYRNNRLISNEEVDNKCNNQYLVPIYNTAPGFPKWFKDMNEDDHLKNNILFSKLLKKALN